MERAANQSCLACRHFANDPRYLERIYHGLSSLSSGDASVRKDDGVCNLREIYLSADGWCGRFEARAAAAARDAAQTR